MSRVRGGGTKAACCTEAATHLAVGENRVAVAREEARRHGLRRQTPVAAAQAGPGGGGRGRVLREQVQHGAAPGTTLQVGDQARFSDDGICGAVHSLYGAAMAKVY